MTATHDPDAFKDELRAAASIGSGGSEHKQDPEPPQDEGWLEKGDDPELERFSSDVCDFAKGLIETSPKDEEPMAVVIEKCRGDAQVRLLPVPPEEAAKAAIQQIVVPGLIIASGANRAAVAAAAWQSAVPVKQAHEHGIPRPSKDPNRKEILVVTAVSNLDNEVHASADVQRNAKGIATVSESAERFGFAHSKPGAPYTGEWSFWMLMAFRYMAAFGPAADASIEDPTGVVKVGGEFVEWARRLYRAERNEPCPCGSGVKFKNCCAERFRKRKVGPIVRP